MPRGLLRWVNSPQANQRAALGESWRSPDALLALWNKNIHGLIDWRLGLDLLSVLRDADFVSAFQDLNCIIRCKWKLMIKANEAASMLALAMESPKAAFAHSI